MRSAFVSVALLTAACSASSDVPIATVADSAGIRIVTNPPGLLAAVPTWEVGSAPAMELTSPDDGAFTLFRVGDVVPLPDGRIAVLNTGQRQVLVFGTSGALSVILGREGDGPGEFRRPSAVVAMAGDSVGVYDGGQRRLSVFDPGGVLRRDVSFRGLRSANGYQELHGLQDRSLLLGDHEGFGEHRGVFREAVDVWRVSKAGRMEDLLGTFPGWEHFAGQYGHAVAGQVTFGAGFCLASVETGFVVGTTDKPELQLHDASGALTGLVRWPDHDRVVTEERFDSFASAALAAIPEEARAQARKTLDAIPRAEREPAYQTILADDAGRLWVGAYAGASAAFPGTRPPERGWMIFDADGALAARATTPGGFRATAVRGGRLYGIFIDELGVESVRVYRVRGM